MNIGKLLHEDRHKRDSKDYVVVILYVIIVYDIAEERVNKVRIYLKQYLNWVQNSVLEGELTEAEYMKVMKGLQEIIVESQELCDLL